MSRRDNRWGATGYPGSHNGVLLPSSSILSPGPALERGKITQALIDVLAVIFAGLFVFVAAVSVVVAFAILLFVRL